MYDVYANELTMDHKKTVHDLINDLMSFYLDNLFNMFQEWTYMKNEYEYSRSKLLLGLPVFTQ